MRHLSPFKAVGLALVAVLLAAACSPSAPTTAPAQTTKPAATTVPAATTAPAPAEPAATTAPTAIKPAASTPAPAAATKSAAPAFDEAAVASFYQGKTIHILVGSAAGGGYDLYSRMIARHMGKYIPGNPTVVVDNMPGAGGALALKTLYTTSPKDGTFMGNFQGGLASQQLHGATSAADYDVTKLQYLGAPATNTWVLVMDSKAMAAKGIHKIQDVLGPDGKQIVIGGNAPGSGQYDAAVLLRDLAHANAKVVGGYGGTSQIKIAMEQGEVDAFFVGWESVKTTNRDDIEKGNWKLLVQMKEKPHPELKDVPLISSVLDEQTMKLMRYGLIMPDQFLRPYAVAGEVPADRVAALRQAFEKALQDPELRAEAEKSKLDLAPIPAADLRDSIVEYMAMPSDVKDILKKSLVAGS